MTAVAIDKPSPEAISDEITADRKTSKRPRGYIDWSPQAKTLAVLEKVQAIVAEYEAHWPITNRQILYRMIGRFGFEKQNEDKLYYVLDKARRARIIPFEAIRDDGVVEYSPSWYRGPDGFWDHVGREVNGYRRDRQVGQPAYMELWTEAEGMAPQLAAVAAEFSVRVFTNGGTTSISAVRQVVDRACEREVPTILLHVGDFDPHGESLFGALIEDAQAFLEEDRIIGIQRIEPVRVALTVEQVEAFGLPTQSTAKPKTPALATLRKRWIDRYGDRTCQAEALPPDKLAEVVREAIESRIERFDTYLEQVDQEERDRIALTRALPSGGLS